MVMESPEYSCLVGNRMLSCGRALVRTTCRCSAASSRLNCRSASGIRSLDWQSEGGEPRRPRPRTHYDAQPHAFRQPMRHNRFDESFAGENLRKIDWSREQLEEVGDVWNYTPHEVTVARSKEDVEKFYEENEVTMAGKDVPSPILTFEETNFDRQIVRALSKSYSSPTVIQSVALPTLMQGRDFIGVSKTGSGKTLAFLLPALIKAQSNKPRRKASPKVLVLCPTRELAQQVFGVSRQYEPYFRHRTICLFGGASKMVQMQRLSHGVTDVCVATPGRLLDLLEEGGCDLRSCTYLVLDEADRMLDMGFEPQIRRILDQMRPDRQTGLFSATWPEDVRELADEFIRHEHVRATIGSEQLSANTNITQHTHVVDYSHKMRMLSQLLEEEMAGPEAKVLLFTNTKRQADRLSDWLYQHNDYATASLHGGHTQAQRDAVMRAFRDGRVRLLIATDVAARGIDVSDISCVVNFDFPTRVVDYVHRIGRTGRNRAGVSHTLVCAGDPLCSAPKVAELIGILRESEQHVPEELTHMAKHPMHRPRKHSASVPRKSSHRMHGHGHGPPARRSQSAHVDEHFQRSVRSYF